jgi:hypothetical protein
MSSKIGTAFAGALLVCAIASGPALAKDKHKETPEEREYYELSIQQELKAAHDYNQTPEGKAEVRRRFQHDAQWEADQEAAGGAQIQERMSPNYRPPVQQEQHMCSVNYGDTIGQVPCP